MRSRPIWFLVAFLAVNGLRFSDARDFDLLATDPLVLHPDPDRQFLHGSPLPIFLGAPLARALGGDVAYALVCAAGLLVVGLALGRFIRQFPAQQAEILCLVLLSAPLLLVLTRWIGKSDPFLVGFYLLLLTGGPGPRCWLAVAMVLCHREIGTLILLVHVLVWRRDAAPVLAGLAFGHCLMLVYLFVLLPEPPLTRAAFAERHASQLIATLSTTPVGHLVFSLNWFWIFFIVSLKASRDLLATMALIALLGIAALAFDFTRVLSLTALPIIVRVAVRLASDPAPLAFLRAAPFPLLFLAQFQIEGAGRVHDWSWVR